MRFKTLRLKKKRKKTLRPSDFFLSNLVSHLLSHSLPAATTTIYALFFSSYPNKHLPIQLPFPLFSNLHLQFCYNSDFGEEDLIFAHSLIQNQFEVTFASFTSQFFFFSSMALKMASPKSPNDSSLAKRFGITI